MRASLSRLCTRPSRLCQIVHQNDRAIFIMIKDSDK
jgi:hypothetical protein